MLVLDSMATDPLGVSESSRKGRSSFRGVYIFEPIIPPALCGLYSGNFGTGAARGRGCRGVVAVGCRMEVPPGLGRLLRPGTGLAGSAFCGGRGLEKSWERMQFGAGGTGRLGGGLLDDSLLSTWGPAPGEFLAALLRCAGSGAGGDPPCR